jgi:hypothetical protein
MMRILALAVLAIGASAIGMVSTAGPATAQAWDPNYPVCMQVFGRVNYNDCRFTSLGQCAASASGRAAECMVNPYFANASSAPLTRHHRRHHRAY